MIYRLFRKGNVTGWRLKAVGGILREMTISLLGMVTENQGCIATLKLFSADIIRSRQRTLRFRNHLSSIFVEAHITFPRYFRHSPENLYNQDFISKGDYVDSGRISVEKS